MADLDLTEADERLGAFLVGVIRGYEEGYNFGVSNGPDPDPETGRDDGGDRSPLVTETPSPCHPVDAAATGPGTPNPTVSTDPDAESDPGDEGKAEDDTQPLPMGDRLDQATKRGMILSLRALSEEYAERGMVEASLVAEQHADALVVSDLRSYE